MRVFGRVAAIAVLLLPGLLWLIGCSTNAGRSAGSVAIMPDSALLAPGRSQTFVSNMPVQWSVLEDDGGYITSSGVYTAPGTVGTFHVVATSLSDPAKKRTATVTVASSGVVSVLTATPMADAVTHGLLDGANLVRWPFMSDRVIAYFIYRDNNLLAPIAVVPGSILEYQDSASPLPQIGAAMETVMVDIEIDPDTGAVTRFETDFSYEPGLANQYNSQINLQPQSLHIACRRVPIQPGETRGYQVQILYEEYKVGDLNDPAPFPNQYRLYLGNRSGTSEYVTLIQPPQLSSPAQAQYPVDGIYTGTQSPGAWSYVLQVSSSPTFTPFSTQEYGAIPNGAFAQAYVEPYDLFNRFAAYAGKPLYWRMGARADNRPLPQPLDDPNQEGWVFSQMRFFPLPQSPPPPPG
ncbi:MAG: hypothetical protein ACYDCO_28340 [Armatimonadota bacterium]